MRALAILLGAGLAFGASACQDDSTGPGGVFPSGPSGSGENFLPCASDNDCTNGDVCARDDECLPPSQVRSVMVRWTVGGQPANATTCAPLVAAGEMSMEYASTTTSAAVTYSPLMCSEGQFFLDVWPVFYDTVTARVGQGPAYDGLVMLAASGNQDVSLDLEPVSP